MLRGPTRSGCSRSSPGPRWPPCPGSSPRTFYDLVVEVALIRPGPIQGGSVHPYIRRRNGQEPVDLPAPAAGDGLDKTLGCRCSRSSSCRWPSTCAGFTAGEADQLRQAMGSKRSHRDDGAAARPASTTGMAAQRDHRRGRRRDLREARRLRQLRLPREPLGAASPTWSTPSSWLKLLLPGGVLRGAARRPADGLLLARSPWSPTPAGTACVVRGPDVNRRPRPTAGACEPRPGAATGGAWPSGSGWPGSRGDRATTLAERIDGRARARTAAYARPGGPGPPGPADRRAGRGAGHRGRVRLLRARTAGQALWAAGAVRRGPARTGCPAPRSGSTRPPLPGMTASS